MQDGVLLQLRVIFVHFVYFIYGFSRCIFSQEALITTHTSQKENPLIAMEYTSVQMEPDTEMLELQKRNHRSFHRTTI